MNKIVKILSIVLPVLLLLVITETAFGQNIEIPQTTGQVGFTKTLLETPVQYKSGTQGIGEAVLFNEKFIGVGECGGGQGSARDRLELDEQGGLWVLSQSGEVSQRNLCMDGGSTYMPIFFHGDARSSIDVAGDKGLVVYVQSRGASGVVYGDGYKYGDGAKGVIFYKLQGNRLSKSAFTNDIYDINEYDQNVVATSDYVFASNRIFELPDLDVVEDSLPFEAIASIDDYVIGFDKGWDESKVRVYEMNGDNPEEVQILDVFENSHYIRYGYDYSGGKTKIAIVDPYDKVVSNTDSTIYIYEAGDNGLELVDQKKLPGTYQRDAYSSSNAFGIYGEYLVIPNSSKFILYQGSEKVGEVALPKDPIINKAYSISNLIITPDKKIFASNGYGAYLFEITAEPGEEDNTDPTDPSDPTQEPQQLDINALMEQYGITPLRDYNFQDSATNYFQSFSNTFFNSTNQTTTENQQQATENYTLSRPPQTIAEIRAFQCAYNIVCEGSIATTGYGNLGPKTQAKINEVFGTGDVNGTHTTIQTSGMTIQEMQTLIVQLLEQVEMLRQQLGSQS